MKWTTFASIVVINEWLCVLLEAENNTAQILFTISGMWFAIITWMQTRSWNSRRHFGLLLFFFFFFFYYFNSYHARSSVHLINKTKDNCSRLTQVWCSQTHAWLHFFNPSCKILFIDVCVCVWIYQGFILICAFQTKCTEEILMEYFRGDECALQCV